jgi:hypothetical protein
MIIIGHARAISLNNPSGSYFDATSDGDVDNYLELGARLWL